MPARAAIVLADGQTSPANYTFTPNSIQGTTILYDDGGDPISVQYTLGISYSRATKKGAFSVLSAIFRIPYIDSEGVVVAYEQARHEHRSPYVSTLESRKDIFAFSKNLYANADFKTFITLQQNYLA